MIPAGVQKGRLENILDEFTDVHGTVLLGMHKELQTLKHEVDLKVESRIGAFLKKVQEADSGLSQRIETSHLITTRLDVQGKQTVAKMEATGYKAIADIVGAREAGMSDLKALLRESGQMRHEFKQDASQAIEGIVKAHGEFQGKISASIKFASMLNAESQGLLKEVGEQQAAIKKREEQLQKRTRQVSVGVGLVLLTTMGFWIWLTLKP
jgi:hypothetical protein